MRGKEKIWGGGSPAFSVSCRGKLARSRDLVIGPVIRHKRVAAALPENIATNHNITQRGEDKSRKNMDGNKLLKVRRRCNVTRAQADVIWPYQRNTAKCSQETLAQSPGDEAAEASIAPGVGLQGKLLRMESLALLKQNRGEWPGEASRPRQKGPGLFPPAMKRKKREWLRRQRKVRTTTDLRACVSFCATTKGIWYFSLLYSWLVRVFFLAPQHPFALFCTQPYKDCLPRYRDFCFFLLGCYPEHSNLIRPFDKHLTQSSGLLYLLPTAQGKRLRQTNFHPQFSLF